MHRPDPDKPAPLRVGLTGGIASGKSTVAGLFAALGTEVIDADQIARELVAPGEPALAEVIATFGEGVIGHGGELDRRKLREIVFASPELREKLEAILHPKIYRELDVRARAAKGPYVIVVIPLLAEAGARGILDRVLVVDCEQSEQLERLLARDAVDEATARRMLAAQADRDARLRLADDVLENRGSREDLKDMVLKLHRRYRALGEGRAEPPVAGLRLP